MIAGTIAIAVPLGIAGGGCTGITLDSTAVPNVMVAQSPIVPRIEVVGAKAGTLQPSLEVVGVAHPAVEATLTARAEGRVVALLVDIGEQVRRGQALARLEAAGGYDAVHDAEADLHARQLEMKQIADQYDEAGTRAVQMRVEAERLHAEALKFRSLYEQGALPRLRAEQAEQAALSAEQNAARAARLAPAIARSLRAARARMAAQQAVLRQRQTEAGRIALIRAPFDGRVVELGVGVGDTVPPRGAIVHVADLSALNIDLPASLLKEGEVASVSVGDRVPVVFDAAEGALTLKGVITQVSARSGLQVQIDDARGDRRLAPGLAARVRLPGRVPKGQVLVPIAALAVVGTESRTADRTNGDGTKTAADSALPAVATTEATVFVVRGTGERAGVERRRVRLGRRAGSQVEVVAGLADGERIVVRSDHPLPPAGAVQVSPYVSQ